MTKKRGFHAASCRPRRGRCRGALLWRVRRDRAGLSHAADPGDRDLQRRRHERHLHARARRRAAEAPRPADRDREPPGGAFNIGTRACAEAPPDGYTICIIPGEPLVFNQFLFKTLNFDPAALEPITQLFLIDQALVVSESLKVKSSPSLPRCRRPARHAQLFDRSGAARRADRADEEGLCIDMVRVPFRGGGEAVNALLSGATPVGFYGISNVRARRASTVTGLMVDSDKRSPLFPDIPTIRRRLARASTRARISLCSRPAARQRRSRRSCRPRSRVSWPSRTSGVVM